MPNGALPQYLRRIEPPAKERLRLMHEIALGMVYLHSRGGGLATLGSFVPLLNILQSFTAT